jgi:hypothetical protein
MIHDPIVKEIHQARQKILEECDGDLDRLMDRLKAAEAQHGHRVVTVEQVRAKRSREPHPHPGK